MKIAAFVNLESVIHPEWLKGNLSKLNNVECFYSEEGNFDLNTLCTGVEACYQDYDYVLLLNAPEQGEYEPLQLYTSRQRYYLNGMLTPYGVFDNAIQLMEKNHLIGALTLPADFLQIENWENFENWSDYYYFANQWLKRNKLHVPISKEKPPILNCPVALIRTEAIRGIEKLNYKVYAAAFFAYTISLYCQANGFLPQYVVPQSILINNYFGFEAFSSLHQEMLRTKQEYYRQNEVYKKSHMKWQEERIQSLEEQLRESARVQRQMEEQAKNDAEEIRLMAEQLRLGTEQIRQGTEQIHVLEERLQEFNQAAQQLESIRQSTSWRITAPLRAVMNAIRSNV